MRFSMTFAATLVTLGLGGGTAFATVPTFTSGPAVAATQVGQVGIDASTVVFGLRNGAPVCIPRATNNRWINALIDQAGGPYDGDPAALYVNSTSIMMCAHGSTGPSYFFCTVGRMIIDPVSFWPDGNLPGSGATQAVGVGTFAPGASPALVKLGSTIYIFGRGMDNQLWFAKVDTSVAGVYHWQGWWQVPPYRLLFTTQTFSSDPAVTTFDNNGLLVCAQRTGTTQYLCNRYSSSSGTWAGWKTAPGTGSFQWKPALARTGANSYYLFGIGSASPHYQDWSTSSDALTWSAAAHIGVGANFLSGPSVVATTSGISVLTMAKGGDSAFWYATGSSSAWGGWNQLQTSP